MSRRVFIDSYIILDPLLVREDAVVTRNKKDYKAAEIPVLDAAECVQLLGS